MLALALVSLTLTAGDITFDEVGFAVARRSDQLVVSRVDAEGVAAKAGLQVDDVIESVLAPSPRSSLATLDDQQVRAYLLPTWEAPVALRIKRGKASRIVQLTRPGKRTEPEFPTMPLPPEELKKLPPMQMARYMSALSASARANRPTAKTFISHDANPQVWVADGRVVESVFASWTGAWVHLEASLRWNCAGAPMRTVTLRSEKAPVPTTIVESKDEHLQGASTPISVPMWRIADLTSRCPAPTTAIPSVPVEAEVRCEGQPPVTQPLTATLEVRCDQAPNQSAMLDALRLFDNELTVIEQPKPLRATVWWSRAVPKPVSAVLVEVDPKGGVVGTRSKVLPWQADDAVVPFTLELKPPRAITLALQFTFADGSTRLSSVQPMRTVTKAAFDKEMEAFSTAGGQLSDVMKRLKDPCKDLEATVRFLEQQPEVKSVSRIDGDITYVGKAPPGLPMLIHCHAEH